jgi:hypothetical protein
MPTRKPSEPVNKPPLAKPDDPAESKRFIDMAREVEADESPEAFDKAFDKVIKGPQRRNAKPPAPKEN